MAVIYPSFQQAGLNYLKIRILQFWQVVMWSLLDANLKT